MKKEKEIDALEGIEMLRDAVEHFNERPEFMNVNKTAIQLINEFKRLTKK